MGHERTLAARHAQRRSSARTRLGRLVAPLLNVTRAASAVLVACLLCLPPVSVLAQSVTATSAYDDAGRLRTTTYSDGKAVGYELDAAGNRKSTAEGALPQLNIAIASVTEGGTLVFAVTRTGTPAATFTVDCAQTNGTAIAGSDYTASTQTLTFLVTDTSKNCSVATLQDTIYEGPNTLGALLQNPVGSVLLATSAALGTINDNDAAPSFSVSGATLAEGARFPSPLPRAAVRISSTALLMPSLMAVPLLPTTTTPASSSSATFAAGQTTLNVVVPTTADSKYELNETVLLNLSNPSNGATISTGQATGTITNNDSAPSFSIDSPAAVNEGNLITFTVTKGGNTNTGLSHSFNWATANNTAVAPSDYTAASGSITFATTDNQKTFQVQTVTDGVLDSASNETFFANLTTNAGTNGATLSTSQGTGSIADLDASIPSVPANIRKSPATGTDSNYSILWDASTGTVNHYTLEEVESAPGSGTLTYSSTTTFKAFNKGDVYLELTYRVRACTTAGESQCSGYSSSVFKMVCPAEPFGCP